MDAHLTKTLLGSPLYSVFGTITVPNHLSLRRINGHVWSPTDAQIVAWSTFPLAPVLNIGDQVVIDGINVNGNHRASEIIRADETFRVVIRDSAAHKTSLSGEEPFYVINARASVEVTIEQSDSAGRRGWSG